MKYNCFTHEILAMYNNYNSGYMYIGLALFEQHNPREFTGNVLIKDNGEAAICDFGRNRIFFKEHDSDQRVLS